MTCVASSREPVAGREPCLPPARLWLVRARAEAGASRLRSDQFVASDIGFSANVAIVEQILDSLEILST
jgi:hypothetical protein